MSTPTVNTQYSAVSKPNQDVFQLRDQQGNVIFNVGPEGQLTGGGGGDTFGPADYGVTTPGTFTFPDPVAIGGEAQQPIADGYTISGPLSIGPQESTLSQTMHDLISLNDNNVIVSKSTGDTSGNSGMSVYAEYTNTNTIQTSQALSGTCFTTGVGTGTVTASSVGTVGIGVTTPGPGNSGSEFAAGILGSAQIGTYETLGQDAGTVPRLASVYAAANTNWGLTANAAINAGLYVEPQNGVGALNAAVYIREQGTDPNDYAVFVVDGNSNLGPDNTTVGMLLPYTIYSASGTPLPTASTGLTGAKAVVSDATSPTWMGAYTSGGTVTCPVFCNGTEWLTA